MAAKRKRIPRYSKVQINGHEYYKTDIEDADGKRVIQWNLRLSNKKRCPQSL